MPKPYQPLRLDLRKTYKLFINGEFVRSESGRSDAIGQAPDDVANVARASRKDLRSAVDAARVAFPQWSGLSPLARGQALYQIAEAIDARRQQFALRIRQASKADDALSMREVGAATDRTLWYAGWCDKYAALVSSRNPVAGPFFSSSAPEPMGVVGVVAPDEPALLGLVSSLVPPLVSGNTVVVVASEIDPRTAVELAECFSGCDLLPGTINLLTGKRIELAPALARHLDVDALDAHGLDPPFAAELERLGTDNLKRIRALPALATSAWFAESAQDLTNVSALTELKTIWHPVGA